MKKRLSLAALLPGFLSLNSSETLANTEHSPSYSDLDDVVIAPLNAATPIYLAGHRSHSSHSSHSSHRSSSGGGSYTPSYPTYTPPVRRSEPLSQPSNPSYTAPAQKKEKKKEKDLNDRETVIMRVQLALKIEGYYMGPIDGKMGPMTRDAINRYRKDQFLPEAVGIDVRLLNALGIAAP